MPAESQVAVRTMTNGRGAAAVLAAGLGAFAMGLIAVIADKAPQVARALNFYRPTGPLSGVSTVAIAIWLGCWAILHSLWRERNVELRRVAAIALLLLGGGMLLTFPPLADLF